MSTPYTIYDKYGQQYTFTSIFYSTPSPANIKIIKTDGISELVGQLHVSQYQSNILINSNILTNSNNIFTYDKNALISSFSPSIYNNNNILEGTNTFNLCSRQSNTYDNIQPYLTVHKGVSSSMHNTMVDIIASGNAISNKSTSARIRIDARNLQGKDTTGGYIKLQTIKTVGGDYIDILSASNTGVNIIGDINSSGGYYVNGVNLNTIFSSSGNSAIKNGTALTGNMYLNGQLHVSLNNNNILICSNYPYSTSSDIFTYDKNALISSFDSNIINNFNTFNLCSRDCNIIQPYLTVTKGFTYSNIYNTSVDIIAQSSADLYKLAYARIRMESSNIILQIKKNTDYTAKDILLANKSGVFVNGDVNVNSEYQLNGTNLDLLYYNNNYLTNTYVTANYRRNLYEKGQLHISQDYNKIIINNFSSNGIFTYDTNVLSSYFDPSTYDTKIMSEGLNTVNLCSVDSNNVQSYLTVNKITPIDTYYSTIVDIKACGDAINNKSTSARIRISSSNLNDNNLGGTIYFQTKKDLGSIYSDILIASSNSINVNGIVNISYNYLLNNINLDDIFKINYDNNIKVNSQIHVNNNNSQSIINASSSNNIFTYDTNALVSSFDNNTVFNLCSRESNIIDIILPYITVTKSTSTLYNHNTIVDINATGINKNGNLNFDASSAKISLNSIDGSISFKTIKTLNGPLVNIMVASNMCINVNGIVNSSNGFFLNGISIDNIVNPPSLSNITIDYNNYKLLTNQIHIYNNSIPLIITSNSIITYSSNSLVSSFTPDIDINYSSINLSSRTFYPITTSENILPYLTIKKKKNYITQNDLNTILDITSYGFKDKTSTRISLDSINGGNIIFKSGTKWDTNNNVPIFDTNLATIDLNGVTVNGVLQINDLILNNISLNNTFYDNRNNSIITCINYKQFSNNFNNIKWNVSGNGAGILSIPYNYLINNSLNNGFYYVVNGVYVFLYKSIIIKDRFRIRYNTSTVTDNWSIYTGNVSYNLCFKWDGSPNIISLKPYYTNDSRYTIVTSLSFTGQHRCISFNKSLYNDYYTGYIVSTLNKYKNMNSIYSPNNRKYNISINDSIPIVDLSNNINDKNVFGVISSSLDEYTNEEKMRTYSANPSICATFLKDIGDDRLVINGLGEGAIWVTDYNGLLKSGDLITTSPIPGLGMRQNDNIIHNYTVAKITMSCDFDPQYIPLQVVFTSNYFTSNLQINSINSNQYILKTDNILDENDIPIYVNQYDINSNIIYDYEYDMKYVYIDGSITTKDDYDINHINSNIYRMAFVGSVYKCS